MGVKGSDASAGFVAWTGQKFSDDAELLKILLAAGAVAYVRTTEPQGLVGIDRWFSLTYCLEWCFDTPLTYEAPCLFLSHR
jgi:amidase